MSAKSQHNNILLAVAGFIAVVIIVAIIGFLALDRDPDIIQAGIRRVVYGENYRLTDGIDLLRRAGIEVILMEIKSEE